MQLFLFLLELPLPCYACHLTAVFSCLTPRARRPDVTVAHRILSQYCTMASLPDTSAPWKSASRVQRTFAPVPGGGLGNDPPTLTDTLQGPGEHCLWLHPLHQGDSRSVRDHGRCVDRTGVTFDPCCHRHASLQPDWRSFQHSATHKVANDDDSKTRHH